VGYRSLTVYWAISRNPGSLRRYHAFSRHLLSTANEPSYLWCTLFCVRLGWLSVLTR